MEKQNTNEMISEFELQRLDPGSFVSDLIVVEVDDVGFLNLTSVNNR